MAKVQGEYAIHIAGENGEVVTLLPGDEIPGWAAKKVTNPRVTGQESEDEAAPSPLSDDVPGAADNADAGPPPHAGPGSGKAAWQEYAASQGVAVDDDSRKEDIIAACEEAGVPV
jgi:hypothetical protein